MRNKVLLLLALVLVSTAPLFGQSTSGGVAGTVTDSSGAGLPGVTVELSGPSMQGARTDVTDTKGQFRFNNIPPGEGYKLTATLSGFAPVNKNINHIYLGQQASVDVTMRAAVSEAITVTAEAPLVDVSKTTTGMNVTSSQFASLPAARSFQQLTTMTPGVTLEMADHDSRQLANSPNVGASSAPENNYIIDGLSTTDVRSGTSGTNLTMNFVEEVQVMTGGYSAEFGRSTGGVFNVITKSGGNEFHGDVFGYYRNHSWSPDVVRTRNKELATFAAGNDNKDIGASLGGPLAKDKIWFFAAVDPTRRTTFIGGNISPTGAVTDIGHTYKTNSDVYAGKLTFAATSSHNFVATVFGDPTKTTGWLGAANSDPGAATREQKTGGNNYNVRYTGTLGSNWLLEGSVGRHEQKNTQAPATDVGRNVPRQIDETNGGFEHGGFQRFQNDKATRNGYTLKSTNYLGGHEFRFGIDVESNNYKGDLHEQWYRYFGASRTATNPATGQKQTVTYIQDRSYFVQGSGTTDNDAAFLQDNWKVLPNLQLNLGVRYEEQHLKSAQGVAIAFNNAQADDPTTAPIFGQIKLKNNWAPRLGLVWDPANNGKTKVYAFAGRYFEAIPLDLNIRAINGEKYIIKRQYSFNTNLNGNTFVNPNGSPITPDFFVASTSSLVSSTPLANGLKAQYQDEVSFGTDFQFAPLWKFGVNLTDRELKRVIEDFGLFNDPTDPTNLTSYVIGNPGEGFFGSKYPKPKRYYRAAEFSLQRARANNWQLFSSFVYAKARGNYEGLYISGYDQLDPNITALYDIPSFLVNAMGQLRADKPYQFKVHSSYSFPFGLTIGEGLQFSAGIPVSAQGPEIQVGYGDGTIFLKPRGSEGRTPNYYTLDLHADYRLPFFNAAGRGLSLVVDSFNVTNAHKVLEVDQDYIYEGMDPAVFAQWSADANLDDHGNPKFNAALPHSQYYKTPILYQSPRVVQLGLKFSY